jgi:hypothetical protein
MNRASRHSKEPVRPAWSASGLPTPQQRGAGSVDQPGDDDQHDGYAQADAG